MHEGRPRIATLAPCRPAFCRLFSRLGRLTDLVFTGCGSVIDDAFLVDLSACVSRRLKRFEVDWCGSVSDVGVRAVASACPRLVHFTLFKGRCRSAQRDGVTDRALRTISVKCPRLETLCLTYAHITQKGVAEFAQETSMMVVKLLSNRSAQLWGPTSALLEKRRQVCL
ncbi:hypothetical protein PBRA_005305 [Plasmodiophora brassicae]|uniref:F-box domain-containing protein n=1 Tax=Plasmodiophora brassicae TaxID=37360 RepID=A0A0G4IN90_PLABS|nr:hypothetical protein PBRA_005305 [Plasmodiophora brassicae]